MKQTILIVEDEDRIRRMLKDYFHLKQYRVIEASDGEEAIEMFYENNVDINLVILDVLMPVMDGFEVLKNIRKISTIPVIMLTAKSSEIDQLEGFRRGADDYITKPFSNSVLLAHVEAVLKRTSDIREDVIKIGKIVIEDDKKKAVLGKEDLGLTVKEYELLMYFIENKGIVLSRETLLDNIWGYDYTGGIRTVDTHIKQLRAKLTKDCSYVKTVHGFGYKFEVS